MMFLLLVALGAATQASVREHPAVKIITLLQKLQAQVKEEGEAETVAYSQFQQWCTDLTAAKKTAIAEEDDKISKSSTELEALTVDIETLEANIVSISKELTQDEAGKADADSQREAANADYLDAKSDLEGTITAVSDAITSLESSAPALTQVQQKKVEKALALIDLYAPQAGKKVQAFLHKEDPAGPAQRTYDFKSGGVVEILKQLQTKFEDELKEAEMAESNSANAWKLSDAAAQDELDAGTAAKEKKTTMVSDKGQQKADSQADLDGATEAKSSALAVLTDTEATCHTRGAEFAERTSRRAEEAKAMGEAIEILGKITGGRAKGEQFSGVQVEVDFLQKADDPRAAIVNLLRKAGKKDLTTLADAIAKTEAEPLGSGTFDQVKNMVQKMIFHLMSEQTDEDKHKMWCDTELTKTNVMMADKNATKEALTTDLNALTAEIAELTTGLAANEKDVAELEASVTENTAQRQEEKEENAATVKDAQEAQSAIANAVAVLTDFYKSTGALQKEPWEFTQLRVVRRVREDPPEPELWDAKEEGYGGVNADGEENGPGVIVLLENISVDFATMESTARADETSQQSSHDEWLTATQMNIGELKKDTEMKTARREMQKGKLEAKDADFTHNEKELYATNQYLKDLAPACLGGDSTYADRKAARAAEIGALKQAQEILEHAFDEDAPKDTK